MAKIFSSSILLVILYESYLLLHTQDVGAKLKDKFKTPHDEYMFSPYAKKAEVNF